MPPGRTLNDRKLVEICGSFKSFKEFDKATFTGMLSDMGINPRFRREIISVLSDASHWQGELPKRPDADKPSERERHWERNLKEWRKQEAKWRKVPLQVILPSKALAHLKAQGASHLEDVPYLGEKRIRLYGDELKRILKP